LLYSPPRAVDSEPAATNEAHEEEEEARAAAAVAARGSERAWGDSVAETAPEVYGARGHAPQHAPGAEEEAAAGAHAWRTPAADMLVLPLAAALPARGAPPSSGAAHDGCGAGVDGAFSLAVIPETAPPWSSGVEAPPLLAASCARAVPLALLPGSASLFGVEPESLRTLRGEAGSAEEEEAAAPAALWRRFEDVAPQQQHATHATLPLPCLDAAAQHGACVLMCVCIAPVCVSVWLTRAVLNLCVCVVLCSSGAEHAARLAETCVPETCVPESLPPPPAGAPFALPPGGPYDAAAPLPPPSAPLLAPPPPAAALPRVADIFELDAAAAAGAAGADVAAVPAAAALLARGDSGLFSYELAASPSPPPQQQRRGAATAAGALLPAWSHAGGAAAPAPAAAAPALTGGVAIATASGVLQQRAGATAVPLPMPMPADEDEDDRRDDEDAGGGGGGFACAAPRAAAGGAGGASLFSSAAGKPLTVSAHALARSAAFLGAGGLFANAAGGAMPPPPAAAAARAAQLLGPAAPSFGNGGSGGGGSLFSKASGGAMPPPSAAASARAARMLGGATGDDAGASFGAGGGGGGGGGGLMFAKASGGALPPPSAAAIARAARMQAEEERDDFGGGRGGARGGGGGGFTFARASGGAMPPPSAASAAAAARMMAAVSADGAPSPAAGLAAAAPAAAPASALRGIHARTPAAGARKPFNAPKPYTPSPLAAHNVAPAPPTGSARKAVPWASPLGGSAAAPFLAPPLPAAPLRAVGPLHDLRAGVARLALRPFFSPATPFAGQAPAGERPAAFARGVRGDAASVTAANALSVALPILGPVRACTRACCARVTRADSGCLLTKSNLTTPAVP
jgi:hypothetical protein